MDAPNLDIARERRGLHRLNLDRSGLFSEDDASMSVEDDASTSVGQSITRRIFRASAVFSFVVLTGVGGALAWRSYGDYATTWSGPGLSLPQRASRLSRLQVLQKSSSSLSPSRLISLP